MLREEAIVVGLEGDHAFVINQRKSACGSCHADQSCGTLSGGLGKKGVHIRTHNPINAQVGERVMLEISESHFLKASFMVYALPVVALIMVGAGVRSLVLSLGWVQDAEAIGALAGLAGLGLSFYGLYRYNSSIQNDSSQLPSIRRVVNQHTLSEKGVVSCTTPFDQS